jgi:hypothetical protein
MFPLIDGPVLWVVCGAGRGVGKTRLALDLCRVLPNAVYAKQGTSVRSAGKPAELFRDDAELDAYLVREAGAGRRHLVVESNSLARRGRGDIIIYLETEEGAGGARGLRPDAPELRACAHIHLGWSDPKTVLRDPAVPDRPSADGSVAEDVPQQWRECVRRGGLSLAAESAVLEILALQDRWNRKRRLS